MPPTQPSKLVSRRVLEVEGYQKKVESLFDAIPHANEVAREVALLGEDLHEVIELNGAVRIYGSIKDEGGFEVFIEESTSTHTRPYPGNRQEMDAINETGHEPSMRAKLQQLLHKFQEYQLKEPALLSKETEVFLGKLQLKSPKPRIIYILPEEHRVYGFRSGYEGQIIDFRVIGTFFTLTAANDVALNYASTGEAIFVLSNADKERKVLRVQKSVLR
ncbi:hypothetical protein MMC12_003865 [Toensbergia leucococca]|nr:hypothetical protein [Toensbergia leucococca]